MGREHGGECVYAVAVVLLGLGNLSNTKKNEGNSGLTRTKLSEDISEEVAATVDNSEFKV